MQKLNLDTVSSWEIKGLANPAVLTALAYVINLKKNDNKRYIQNFPLCRIQLNQHQRVSNIYQNIQNTLSYLYKVNRCLARYSPSATTTNRPSNRAPNKPAWPGPNWPKCQFWAKFGRFWAKNPFGQALDKMCKNWQFLAQNDQKCRFWTNFGRFWAKNPNLYGSK